LNTEHLIGICAISLDLMIEDAVRKRD